MSMSSHVVGYKTADATWRQYKAVWDACRAAGVTPPKEVVDYFVGVHPGDNAGMEVRLDDGFGKLHPCCKEYSADGSSGYEIDVTKLPPGVTVIRFYNSW